MSDFALATPGLDKTAFAQCFNRLAKAKRAKDIDQADMQIYYGVLGRYPQWAVEEASNDLMRTPTYGFPTTDVWVKAVEAEIQRRQRETVYQPREWKDECNSCRDSGWVEHQCTQAARCGRRFCSQLGEKHEHSYFSVCPCREHNSTYRRNTLASQLGHAKAETKVG